MLSSSVLSLFSSSLFPSPLNSSLAYTHTHTVLYKEWTHPWGLGVQRMELSVLFTCKILHVFLGVTEVNFWGLFYRHILMECKVQVCWSANKLPVKKCLSGFLSQFLYWQNSFLKIRNLLANTCLYHNWWMNYLFWEEGLVFDSCPDFSINCGVPRIWTHILGQLGSWWRSFPWRHFVIWRTYWTSTCVLYSPTLGTEGHKKDI